MHSRQITRLIAVFAIASLGLVAACGEAADGPSDQETSDQQTDDDNGDDDPETDLDYATLWSDIDATYDCSNSYCHGGSAPLIDSHDRVVDIESECDDTILVVPGEPEESLLWQKVSPEIGEDDVCGDKMPPAGYFPEGEDEFDADMADDLADWIAGGAPEE